MERQIRRRVDEPRRERAPGGSEPAAAPPEPQPQGIQVIFGPIAQPFDFEGMSVGAARGLLQHALNIPPGAAALVNGNPVDPERDLVAGDTLEFVRLAGEKGSAAA